MLRPECLSLHRPDRPTGAAVTVVTAPPAGHRVVLPGERPVRRGRAMARGCTPAADAALGLAAWPHLCRVLGLHTEETR